MSVAISWANKMQLARSVTLWSVFQYPVTYSFFSATVTRAHGAQIYSYTCHRGEHLSVLETFSYMLQLWTMWSGHGRV